MKFLLVVALVAGVRAEAEADPQLLLHTPLVYGAHHAVPHLPVVKSVEVKPAEVKTTPVVTYAHVPYAFNYGLWGHGLPVVLPAAAPVADAEEPAVEAERKKREAEAEADPEADPYYLTYGLHHPYTYGLHYPYVKPVVKTVEVKTPAVTYAYNHLPYTYGYHGVYPYSYGYPYVVTKPVEAEEPAVEAERKKREAEADPAILASSTVVKTPLTYTLPYTLPYATHGLTYAANPVVYANHGLYSGLGYPYTYGLWGHGLYAAAPVAEAEPAVEAER